MLLFGFQCCRESTPTGVNPPDDQDRPSYRIAFVSDRDLESCFQVYIMDNEKILTLNDIIQRELQLIASKRKNRNPQDDYEQPEKNLFGIALSGGGIRSATINLGILEILNKVGILPKADYLSTVSGGGYIGGYIHAKLWQKDAEDTQTSSAEQHTESYDLLLNTCE